MIIYTACNFNIPATETVKIGLSEEIHVLLTLCGDMMKEGEHYNQQL